MNVYHFIDPLTGIIEIDERKIYENLYA